MQTLHCGWHTLLYNADATQLYKDYHYQFKPSTNTNTRHILKTKRAYYKINFNTSMTIAQTPSSIHCFTVEAAKKDILRLTKWHEANYPQLHKRNLEGIQDNIWYQKAFLEDLNNFIWINSCLLICVNLIQLL